MTLFMLPYRFSYTCVHACRHMVWCEYMYVCVIVRVDLYICVWLWVDHGYVCGAVCICKCSYRGRDIFVWEMLIQPCEYKWNHDLIKLYITPFRVSWRRRVLQYFMSSQRVNKNLKIGMFTPAFIQVESFCYRTNTASIQSRGSDGGDKRQIQRWADRMKNKCR